MRSQTFQFLQRMLLGFLRHAGLANRFPQLLNLGLGVLVFAEFLLGSSSSAAGEKYSRC